MPDPAIGKVEDALKAVLDDYTALDDYTKYTALDQSEALNVSDLPAIVIFTVSQSFDLDGEQHQTTNDCLINFEILEKGMSAGVLTRSLQTAAGHIMTALAADRTLGGRLQELEERDLAPPNDTGRDIAGASLQYSVQFFTSREDPFTIVGHGQLTF